MANLKNLDKIWTAPLGTLTTVGNNRQIQRNELRGRDAFMCYLHGWPICEVSDMTKAGLARITLNTCGFRTVTTRAAMHDFMRAFGVEGGVSFAKGQFTVRFKNTNGVAREVLAESTVSFVSRRYVVA